MGVTATSGVSPEADPQIGRTSTAPATRLCYSGPVWASTHSTTPSSRSTSSPSPGSASYFARFQKTTGDYFLTGRSVPWWAICFTIVATETSTLTFIGVPAAAYAGNMTFLQLAMGYVHRPAAGQRAVHPGLLPRRSRHLVRAAAAAVRVGRQDRRRRAVPDHAVAGRRHPPVRDRAGDRHRHRRAGVGHDRHARRRDDDLHGARRRGRGDLDRRRADVHLRRRRAGGVRRAAVEHPRRLGRSGAARRRRPASSR